MGEVYPSVLWYVGLLHLISRGCGPLSLYRPGRTSPNIDQTLSHVRHYYKIHGRSSIELLSAAVLGVKRAVRIESAMSSEDPFAGRKLPFTGDMIAPAIIFTVQGFPGVISSSHWHFGEGSATCFAPPSI